VYFKHKVSSTLENKQKASSVRELDVPQIVSNNLDRAAKAFEGLSPLDDQLSNTLRIQWLDLKAPVEDLNITLKDNISFFNAAIAYETSGTGSDHKAYTVAQFIAAVFLKIDRTVP
jgi:hypothetical protein